MPILQQILLIVCATLSDPVLLNAARIRAGAFTRNNGKLPFWTMMELLMVNRKNTITSSMMRVQQCLSNRHHYEFTSRIIMRFHCFG